MTKKQIIELYGQKAYDDHLARNRQWQQDNKKLLRKSQAKWRLKNRDRFNKYQNEYYHRNKEKILGIRKAKRLEKKC